MTHQELRAGEHDRAGGASGEGNQGKAGKEPADPSQNMKYIFINKHLQTVSKIQFKNQIRHPRGSGDPSDSTGFPLSRE
jgi:hypothetical protein